jgi:CheY-like chemotaxis protein
MARPITSEKYYRSSLPASDPARKEGETGRTSTFPVPSSSNVGSERSSRGVDATGKASGVPSSKGGSTSMQECRARLMIVDDEIQLLTMFKRIFEPQGYKVTTFSDSSKALAEFKRNSDGYDLAILDQRMPELTGANLAVQMITQRPDFPIILLTGFSDTVTPDDAARIGIRKYLSKPIRQAKLSETIRNVLQESYGQ